MAQGGSWNPTALPILPGLYANFVQAAAAQIRGGARGIVAIPLLTYGSNATAKTFYTVEDEKQATDLFGAANVDSILLSLAGGAKEVLVYTMPSTPVEQDYIDMRDAFDARPFNVFVFDQEYVATEQDATKTWVKRNREEGKHFLFVAGGSAADDADPAVGDARTTRLKDEYVVNLTVGRTLSGVTLSSGELAPYIAGLIAGTAINKTTTYVQVPADDVNKRLTNAQMKAAVTAGSLALINDGEKVKVLQGLVSTGQKIRIIRARQAILTDITKAAADNFIGKIDNNPDGQAALISAVKAYLERLEDSSVLRAPVVGLDPQYQSVGDSVFLLISYVEVDSMERIFLTINV